MDTRQDTVDTCFLRSNKNCWFEAMSFIAMPSSSRSPKFPSNSMSISLRLLPAERKYLRTPAAKNYGLPVRICHFQVWDMSDKTAQAMPGYLSTTLRRAGRPDGKSRGEVKDALVRWSMVDRRIISN